MTGTRQEEKPDALTFLNNLNRVEENINQQINALKPLEHKALLLPFPSAIDDTKWHLLKAKSSLADAKIALSEYNLQNSTSEERSTIPLAKISGCMNSIANRLNKIQECMESIDRADIAEAYSADIILDLNNFTVVYNLVSPLYTELCSSNIYKAALTIRNDSLKDEFLKCIQSTSSTELKPAAVSALEERKPACPEWQNPGARTTYPFFLSNAAQEMENIIQSLSDYKDNMDTSATEGKPQLTPFKI